MYEVAVLLIHFLSCLQQRNTLCAVEGRHFADKHRGHNSILVSYIRACQIAVALLEAEYIAILLALCLKETDLLTDELEAGEHLSQFNAVFSCDLLADVSGNDSLYSHRVFGHGAESRSLLKNVFQQHSAHLVAGEQHVIALRVGNSNAHAVAVRVGSQQQVGLYSLAKLKPLSQRLLDLRIRERAGGEIAVRQLLLRNYGDLLDTDLFKDSPYRLVARAVKRSIYHLQTAVSHKVGMYSLFSHLVKILVDDLLLDILDLPLCKSVLKAHDLSTAEHRHGIYLSDNGVRSVKSDLTAVLTIDLIAIVLCGVMGCSHHYARLAAQFSYRP